MAGAAKASRTASSSPANRVESGPTGSDRVGSGRIGSIATARLTMQGLRQAIRVKAVALMQTESRVEHAVRRQHENAAQRVIPRRSAGNSSLHASPCCCSSLDVLGGTRTAARARAYRVGDAFSGVRNPALDLLQRNGSTRELVAIAVSSGWRGRVRRYLRLLPALEKIGALPDVVGKRPVAIQKWHNATVGIVETRRLATERQ